jgi:hypothetical protein
MRSLQVKKKVDLHSSFFLKGPQVTKELLFTGTDSHDLVNRRHKIAGAAIKLSQEFHVPFA